MAWRTLGAPREPGGDREGRASNFKFQRCPLRPRRAAGNQSEYHGIASIMVEMLSVTLLDDEHRPHHGDTILRPSPFRLSSHWERTVERYVYRCSLGMNSGGACTAL